MSKLIIRIQPADSIQKAIDDCFLQGGGIVELSAGVYKTGCVRLRSNVTLYLKSGATILGSRDPMDYYYCEHDPIEPLPPEEIADVPYVPLWTIHGETQYEENKPEYRFKRLPESRWNHGLIKAIHAENIAIIGEIGSVIDGADCYDEQGEELYRGPHAIHLFDCKNISLMGYTVKNSANWAHNLLFCKNVLCKGVTVLAGHDGFDVASSENVVIEACAFYTGDDCIAGYGVTNCVVRNCIINSACSAMRFGGTNVLVEKCKIFGPGKYLFRGSLTKEEKISGKSAIADGVKDDKHRYNMLSVFTYYADYSMPIPEQPGNVIITDCEVESADRFLHYNYSGNETWQKHRPLQNITFSNITAKNLRMPITAYGDADIPVSLTMEHVRITDSKEYAYPALLHVCNFKRVELSDVTYEGAPLEVLVKAWSDGQFLFDNVSCGLSQDQFVKKTDEEFICKAI